MLHACQTYQNEWSILWHGLPSKPGACRAALRRRRNVPVWIAGHSLGGGYAAALFVHLLAQRQLSAFFPAGEQH